MNAETTKRLAMLPTPRARVLLGLELLVITLRFGTQWLAGTLADIGDTLALRQRGQLADAIVAPMTTNALIAAYVLSQQAWAL